MIEHPTSLEDPRLDVYARLTELQLRNRLEPEKGIFIAESDKVIDRALAAGYQPLSLLVPEHRYQRMAGLIERMGGNKPAEEGGLTVFVMPAEEVEKLAGYELTRGALCAMRRKALPTAEEICRDARRVAVIDGVCDTTNIGAIFRSAAALGIDGVLLTRQSCDPLNRRSIRVSMGSVFLVPWGWTDDALDAGRYGMKCVALALSDDSVSIDDASLCAEPRLALVLGTEGDGLSRRVVWGADYVARIPMSHGVDSLNVAAASAVAFWQLRVR